MAREEIRDFYGKILGYRCDEGQKIVARDFYGKILGYYDKRNNETRDFFGKKICNGDGTAGLIMSAK